MSMFEWILKENFACDNVATYIRTVSVTWFGSFCATQAYESENDMHETDHFDEIKRNSGNNPKPNAAETSSFCYVT